MADAEEQRKAEKLARKLAKKEAKALQQAASELEMQAKPLKKKKKRSLGDVTGEELAKPKKAKLDNNEEPVIASEQLNGDSEPVKELNGSAGKLEKKKKKKRKAEEPAQDNAAPAQSRRVTDEVTATHLARIGDHDLAKQSAAIQRSFYVESREVADLQSADIQAWQSERSISVEGSSVRPIMTFAQSGLPDAMLHATKSFLSPSPIQAQCIPIALSGRDLVGIAATGSGKTLAFGLPCLRHIAGRRASGAAGKNPKALIISPTRELAQQIASVMEDAGQLCQVSTLCVYGGVPKQPQAQQLRRGVDIVVATPGRLEDLMNDGACKLHEVSYLVLDEADRMLDLGFEPHIRAIASKTRADRQTLMFSATWPSEVQKLAFDYLSSPVRIVIGSQDLSASHSVTQIVEVIEDGARPSRLLELLQKYHKSRKNRVLIFVLYKKEASRIQEKLQQAGWKAAAIHGDINQSQRSKAVEQFKSGAMPLLIATDVAARGLDIPDVEAVINFSFPLTTEDYVHRIGRTGRAGKTGVAHTFFVGANDKARSGELINVLREAGQKVPSDLLAFGTTTKKKESKLYGAHFKDIDPTVKATKITFDD